MPKATNVPAAVNSTSTAGLGSVAPLRVAVDSTPLLGQRSGVGTVAAELIRELAKRDDVDLTGFLVSWRGRKNHRQVLPADCKELHLKFPARVARQLWRLGDSPKLRSTFEVVHGTNYVLPPGGQVGLVTIHDMTAWRYPTLVDGHSRLYPQLVAKAVARGAHVHCVSSSVASEVRSELGIADDRIHVVRNGFSRLPPGNPEKGRQLAGAPYVLALGTVEPRKDYATLVRAMAGVWHQHSDLRLVIAGGVGWGSAAEELKGVIAASSHAANVQQLGYVTDRQKADLLAGATLLAYPSRYEGFGLPLLEAMDAGTPVVATQVGAVAEVAGEAAILVNPGDPDGLAEAILRVVGDEELRWRLVQSGHERTDHFSWSKMANEMVQLYRRLSFGR